MLRLASARPLCKSCRGYLWNLLGFEYSQGTAQGYRHALRYTRRQIGSRNFSNPRSLLNSQPYDRHGITSDSTVEADPAEVDGPPPEVEVINLLEKELGMSLDDAMKKDRTAVEALVQRLTISEDSGISLEAAEDPLQELRDGGATPADIVREARNIFGDSLPGNVLNDEEFVMYRRLYGDPSPDADEDLEYSEDDGDIDLDAVPKNALYSVDGEEIAYSFDKTRSQDYTAASSDQFHVQFSAKGSDNSPEQSLASTKNNATSLVGASNVHELDLLEEESEDDQGEDSMREHPLTTIGKFATSLKTVFLPSVEFVRPVEKLLSNFSNKHIKEMCERTFGGPGLPDSPLTPRSGKFKEQVPIALEAGQSTMGEMEANAFITTVMPPTYTSILSVLVETRKRLGTTWLTELLAREGGPRVLDVSAGGVGIIAWREMLKAQWDVMHSSDQNPPPVPATKSVVVTGSDTLRHRSAHMLEDTTFIPRLPDYVHTRDTPTLEDDRPAQQRKQFDVIIAPHSLFPLKEDWMRKQHVQNLWSLLSPNSGVLILIEKGIPRGFEAIAGAREMLLERYIATPPDHTTHYSTMADDPIHKKETAMIVAPCTTHEKCPMYATPGLSRGRKDICSFQQRYIRPPFLQRILGAGDRNHDDVDFSYLSVVKGRDLRTRQFNTQQHVEDPSSAPTSDAQAIPYAYWLDNLQSGFEDILPDETNDTFLPGAHQLPRAVFPPIKRKGHVSLDVCTPAGSIERWTVPRSFSKQAYRDARKSRWGDLWALGAKTRSARNLSLGVSEKDLASKKKMGEAKVRGRKERIKIQAERIADAREQQKLNDIEEQEALMEELDEEFETSDPVPTRSKKSPSIDSMSDDEVSQVLADWQEDYDSLSPNKADKQTRRLNKLDKQKLKKQSRTQHKTRAGHREEL